MTIWKTVPLGLCVTGLVVACGGGGGGGTTATTTTPDTSGTTTFNSALSALGLNDTYIGNFFGDGGGFGGDNGGSADSGGGAGDGEFVKISGIFPTGTSTSVLTWRIIRSQYGLTEGKDGNTGTLTITRNTDNSGGYKVVAVNNSAAAVRATQANIFVSKGGQVTGTLPLPIAGTTRDVVFSTIRFKESASAGNTADFTAVAGTYGFVQRASDVGTGANRSVTGGVAQILANGKGRFCPGATAYSANCTDGVDVVLVYNTDPTTGDPNGSVITMTTAPTQTTPINPNYTNDINVTLVARAVTIDTQAGVSMTGDWLARNTVTPGSAQRTGAVYMSRMANSVGTTLNLFSARVQGSWSLAWNNISPALSGNNYVGIRFTGTDYKARATLMGGTGCEPVGNQRILPFGVSNGFIASTLQSNSSDIAYLLPIDDDTWVGYWPNYAIALGRRMSGNTGYNAALLACQAV